MKRGDISYIISFLLLFSIIITGTTGHIQSQLDIRRFVPHIYFAYVTLGLAGVHICLNAGRIWRYICRKFKGKE